MREWAVKVAWIRCSHGARWIIGARSRASQGASPSVVVCTIIGSAALMCQGPSGAWAQGDAVAPGLERPAVVVKPPPVPTGVIPLPVGAPVLPPHRPLPSPAGPPLDPIQALGHSLSELPEALRGRPLKIDDVVAVAEATNREFASAVETLYRTHSRMQMTRASMNPTLSVNGEATEFDAPTVADLSAFSGGGNSSSKPGFLLVPKFNPVFTATVGMPIDVAGTLRAAVSQAQFEELAARLAVNSVRNRVVLAARVGFYNVLRAQAQTVVAADRLTNALSRLSDAQKSYAAGTAPRFDVISAQRDVADAQQNQLQARTQVSVSLALLKSTLGVDLRTPITLTDEGAVEAPPELADRATVNREAATPASTVGSADSIGGSPTAGLTIRRDAQGQPWVGSPPAAHLAEDPIELGPEFDQLVAEASQSRPEIMEADAQLAAARKGILIARTSALPTVNLSINDTYIPNAAGFTRRNEGMATLGVTVPLYDGGLSRSRVQAARADVALAETGRRSAQDQVALEVQQAYLALLQARNRVAVARVGVAQAREAARLARVRYVAGVSQQVGVSPILELSNAQNSLAEAQNSEVNALYDYNTARAQIEFAVGRYSGVTTPGRTRSR